jgi:hypothetical protein
MVAVCVVLLGLMTPSALRADNIVVNGGFETGNWTGWNYSNNSGYLTVNGNTPYSGSYAANFGATYNVYDTISQILATSKGTSYTLSFWLANTFDPHSESDSADFQVLWNGTSLEDIVTTTAFGYTEFTFTVTGTGSDTLSFEGYNDPSWTYLDDVSVDATPEPSSFYLLGTAMLLLCGFVMRRKSIA